MEIEVLKKKVNEKHHAGYGNIVQLSKDVFKFTVYNLLGTLEGHFTFYVNIDTFQYVLYKSSDYYNLISVNPLPFKEFITEFDVKRVEAIIAHKLLGAYFFDRNACNSQGKNLFGNGTFEKAGGTFQDHIIRWTDGPKTSLICEPILELNEADLTALEILTKF